MSSGVENKDTTLYLNLSDRISERINCSKFVQLIFRKIIIIIYCYQIS